MLNTSEDLEIKERIVVIDGYCQKLTDSGYDMDQTKRVVIGGLNGYERRRALSLLDPADRKYRPLHESRRYNAKARRIAKIMEKDNWFKKKPEDDTLPEGSPNKKRKMFHQDGQSDQTSSQLEENNQQDIPSSQLDQNNVESAELAEQQGQVDQTSSQLEEKDQADSPSNHLDQEAHTRRIKLRRKKPISPPTIGVMFVEQTPGGLLAKRLQEVEDRLAKASGYRLRMVELSGTPLSRLLPNTNPWAGQQCGRGSCYTCGQGEEKIQDCKRGNILYESSCTLCNPEKDKKKEKMKDMAKKEGVYVG
jgi:hypothetical protein